MAMLLIVDKSKNIWFQPDLQRKQSVDLVKLKLPGSFVIRKSQKAVSGFAVSVRLPDEVIRQTRNPPLPTGMSGHGIM